MQKLLVLVVIVAVGCGGKQPFSNITLVKKSEASMTGVSKAAVLPLSIREFGDTVLAPRITQLINGESKVSILKPAIQKLLVEVKTRYKTERINLNLQDQSNPKSDMIAMGACQGADGVPVIEVTVPFFYSTYYLWSNDPSVDTTWEVRWDNSIAISFAHETLHLARSSDIVCGDNKSTEEHIEDEAQIWYMTCEEFLLPLWEAGSPLSHSDEVYMRMWLELKDSPEKWKGFIREAYKNSY